MIWPHKEALACPLKSGNYLSVSSILKTYRKIFTFISPKIYFVKKNVEHT